MKGHNTESLHRLPAEWEAQSAILMAWPHTDTDWAYMLAEVQDCYEAIIRAMQQPGLHILLAGPDLCEARTRLGDLEAHSESDSGIIFVEVPTNDTWTRDFGPITCVATNGEYILNDFKFNGWGLKFAADRDNLVTRKLFDNKAFDFLLNGKTTYHNRLNFVLEGGSIESDGCGTLMTTSRCLLSPNRNGASDKHEIEDFIIKALGAQRLLWVDHGELAGDDTDAHIDTLARLAPEDTIIYCGCDSPEDEHYQPLTAMAQQLATFRTLQGLPYNLIELPLPDPIYDEDGNRLPATYANYLVTPHKVLMPTYGQTKKDSLAMQMLRIVFHDRDVVGVDCRALIRQHGSLHCATMQLPKV